MLVTCVCPGGRTVLVSVFFFPSGYVSRLPIDFLLVIALTSLSTSSCDMVPPVDKIELPPLMATIPIWQGKADKDLSFLHGITQLPQWQHSSLWRARVARHIFSDIRRPIACGLHPSKPHPSTSAPCTLTRTTVSPAGNFNHLPVNAPTAARQPMHTQALWAMGITASAPAPPAHRHAAVATLKLTLSTPPASLIVETLWRLAAAACAAGAAASIPRLPFIHNPPKPKPPPEPPPLQPSRRDLATISARSRRLLVAVSSPSRRRRASHKRFATTPT